MKFYLSGAFLVSGSAAIAQLLLLPVPASAQLLPGLGMSGSYVGGGVSLETTEETVTGGNIQSRLDIPLLPISVRGAALIGGDSTAVIPIVSYDVPIAPRTNLYVGTGYSFVLDQGESTPLGDQNAVVLTAGAEAALSRRIALYGDVKLGIDAYENDSDFAVSVQLGAAYRF